MGKRKSKRGNYHIEDLGDFELSPEVDAKVQKLTQQADEELDATRVNFRWQREPLNLIKTVAGAMGIPYQTYMKQVLFKQALEDMIKIRTGQSHTAHSAGVREAGSSCDLQASVGSERKKTIRKRQDK